MRHVERMAKMATYKILDGISELKTSFKDLGVNVMIIIKLFIKRQRMELWAVLIWPRAN
jgi:hypothetical protein